MKGIKNLVLSFIFVLLLSININADGFVPNPDGTPPGGDPIGKISVIVERPLINELIFKDNEVDLYNGDSAYTLIVRAANQNEVEIDTSDSMWGKSINGIAGIASGSDGPNSGWTFTLNDWFLHLGADSFSTSTTFTNPNDDLKDGDVIKVMYTITGSDLGGDYYNNDKSLKSIDFSKGNLNKTFKKGTYKYDLKVAKGTKNVLVTPTAANKNFQCRIFVGDKEYRRTKEVAIKEGSVIEVRCGDPKWDSTNNGDWGDGTEDASLVPATIYTFTVKYPKDKEPVKNDDKVNNDKMDNHKKNKSENNQVLPKTGQDLSILYILLAGALASSGTYLGLRRK